MDLQELLRKSLQWKDFIYKERRRWISKILKILKMLQMIHNSIVKRSKQTGLIQRVLFFMKEGTRMKMAHKGYILFVTDVLLLIYMSLQLHKQSRKLQFPHRIIQCLKKLFLQARRRFILGYLPSRINTDL